MPRSPQTQFNLPSLIRSLSSNTSGRYHPATPFLLSTTLILLNATGSCTIASISDSLTPQGFVRLIETARRSLEHADQVHVIECEAETMLSCAEMFAQDLGLSRQSSANRTRRAPLSPTVIPPPVKSNAALDTINAAALFADTQALFKDIREAQPSRDTHFWS